MMKQWYEQIELLSDSQKSQLLVAIYHYQCFGEDFKTDDGMLKMLWSTIRQTFEYNNRKYAERCEKNRKAAKQRWSKSNANAYERNQNYASDADNDIEKDKEIDIDKDIGYDIEKELDYLRHTRR